METGKKVVGYGYWDKTGTFHIVSDGVTASNYSKSGKVVKVLPEIIQFGGGYPVDEEGDSYILHLDENGEIKEKKNKQIPPMILEVARNAQN